MTAFNPFLRPQFFEALQNSGCIGEKAGWIPVNFQDRSQTLYTFKKNHSYGEYIFDWGWAEAYHRHGLPYYPKLTSMIPFTPVTTSHFLSAEMENRSGLITKHDEFYNEGQFSSAHFLFLEGSEIELFRNHEYKLRESIQYHWSNENFVSFDQYLETFKTKKAKTVRKERSFSNIKFNRYSGLSLTEDHAKRMYEFYISTIENKNSYDYLNREFFIQIFRNLSENILYIEATRNDLPIAGSLFFHNEKTLYGRYWGATEYVENLHFELCYYQGIDFCIEKKLKKFEAGAQGEHKIARGFRPSRIYSAHKIKHPDFARAIYDFIEREKMGVAENLEVLSSYLPFKER